MILESIVIIAFALGLDFVFGDPKSKYHPTAWIGTLIAKLTPLAKNQSAYVEKLGGIFVVAITVGVVVTLLLILDTGISFLTTDWLVIVVSVVVGIILLKTTIAIRGMERYALAVVDSLEQDNLDSAREKSIHDSQEKYQEFRQKSRYFRRT